MRPSEIVVALFALTSTPALASIFPVFHQDRRDHAVITARQDDGGDSGSGSTSFQLSLTLTQGNTATTVTSSSNTASATSGGSSGSGSASATGSPSGSGGASSNHTSYATTKTFDARLPAGGVQMITPAPTAAASYYKIMDNVTFVWNYTSLSITPSAVDVLASCTKNQELYTIAVNQTINGSTQAVTWDTGAYQSTASVPLLTEDYTLIIHDAAKDISAVAQAGYLATFSGFKFGMYVPQPYTPLADWQCATCNAAMSHLEKQAFGFMMGMAAICVLSFGWFGGVAGLW